MHICEGGMNVKLAGKRRVDRCQGKPIRLAECNGEIDLARKLRVHLYVILTV